MLPSPIMARPLLKFNPVIFKLLLILSAFLTPQANASSFFSPLFFCRTLFQKVFRYDIGNTNNLLKDKDPGWNIFFDTNKRFKNSEILLTQAQTDTLYWRLFGTNSEQKVILQKTIEVILDELGIETEIEDTKLIEKGISDILLEAELDTTGGWDYLPQLNLGSLISKYKDYGIDRVAIAVAQGIDGSFFLKVRLKNENDNKFLTRVEELLEEKVFRTPAQGKRRIIEVSNLSSNLDGLDWFMSMIDKLLQKTTSLSPAERVQILSAERNKFLNRIKSGIFFHILEEEFPNFIEATEMAEKINDPSRPRDSRSLWKYHERVSQALANTLRPHEWERNDWQPVTNLNDLIKYFREIPGSVSVKERFETLFDKFLRQKNDYQTAWIFSDIAFHPNHTMSIILDNSLDIIYQDNDPNDVFQNKYLLNCRSSHNKVPWTHS